MMSENPLTLFASEYTGFALCMAGLFLARYAVLEFCRLWERK